MEQENKKVILNHIRNISDKELLKECEVKTFRASAKGGQHVNKTETAVRLYHRLSGIGTVCRKQRSQYLNKKECIARLREKAEKKFTPVEIRVKTKIPKLEKIKRREEKKKNSTKKERRKKPDFMKE